MTSSLVMRLSIYFCLMYLDVNIFLRTMHVSLKGLLNFIVKELIHLFIYLFICCAQLGIKLGIKFTLAIKKLTDLLLW